LEAFVAARDDTQAQWSGMMRAAQDGDAGAYLLLLHQIVPFLRAILHHKVASDHVEDVVQEVLLTLHRVRATYDPARPFVPWLVAIAQRRAIDAGRRTGRVRAHESGGDALDGMEAEPAADGPMLERIDAARRADWLREAVRALPRRQRAAVELVKLDELTIAEAAARTGQTPGAVKVNVHRGMTTLRRLLGREPA
jgi:RNA polymerase sigma-70 factor (ECF subfamily)